MPEGASTACPALFEPQGAGGVAFLPGAAASASAEPCYNFRCAAADLAWPRRWPRLRAIILEVEPDLVGLQEVDLVDGGAEDLTAHDSEIRQDLWEAGYEGVFARKQGRACDGVALFWRRARLQASGQAETWRLGRSIHVALAQRLTLDGCWHFTGVATHLKAGLTEDAEDARAAQADALLESLAGHGDAVLLADLNAHCRPWRVEGCGGAAAGGTISDDGVALGQEAQEWHVGTVKFFVPQKGYGFIECPETFQRYHSDVYVHKDLVQRGSLDGCFAGDHIRFAVCLSARGQPQASHVQRYKDGPWVAPSRLFQGRIKKYSVERGYGFIVCRDVHSIFGQDVFLHRRQAEAEQLQEGDHVTFTVEVSSRSQPQARNVGKVGALSNKGAVRAVEPRAYPRLLAPGGGLRSACREVLGDEPDFTCWGGWEDREVRGVFDYILVRGTLLAPRRVLCVPSAAEVLRFRERLPNAEHPTDHVPLAADLEVCGVRPSSPTR